MPRLVDWPKSASLPVSEPYSPITSSSEPRPAHPRASRASPKTTPKPMRSRVREVMSVSSNVGMASDDP